MADRSPRRKGRRRQLKVSHQKNWLTGRYAVLETLISGRWPVSELYLEESTEVAVNAEIQTAASQHDLEPVIVPRDRLTELCGSRHHQGVAARMSAFPYLTFDDAFKHTPLEDSLIVVCDRIQDSHNFGAILRCCDAMKVSAVMVGDHEQAVVSPQVARSSAGAVNHVPIVHTKDLFEHVGQLKGLGYHIAGATEKIDFPVWSTNVTRPTALIVGSEANGIHEQLLAQCDSKLMIPMLGQVASLNVAVAAGILLYELRRRSLGCATESE